MLYAILDAGVSAMCVYSFCVLTQLVLGSQQVIIPYLLMAAGDWASSGRLILDFQPDSGQNEGWKRAIQ